MFVGSINTDLRSLVSEVTKHWTSEEVYIGCSGNFTIERILKDRPFKLFGNDVSMYTSAIGNYLAGKEMQISVQLEEYKWLEEYMTNPLERVATLLLCTTMLQDYQRQEPYFVRKRNAYLRQWKRLHEETTEKVAKGLEGIKLEDYFMGDVVDWTLQAPTDQAFISFPPTYTGGYEKLYKAFNEVFEWEEPEYKMFDDDSLHIMVEAMKEKKEWMISRDEEIPELEDYVIGKVQTSLRSKPVTVYASKATPRITMPHQKTELLKIPRANENTEITEESKLSVKKITQGQMNTLRSLYLNPGIAPASAMMNLAVLVDGKLIGAIGLAKSQFGFGAYMMTDFAIRPLKYKRMSKLVLATALSTEVKLMIEQALNQRVRSITTTAFTDKPISMKYRGLFDLASRKDDPPRLNYEGETGKWTLKGALEWWIKKHSKYMN